MYNVFKGKLYRYDENEIGSGSEVIVMEGKWNTKDMADHKLQYMNSQ